MFINKPCRHCDSRHETYSELVNYFTDSLFLFPEYAPSFYDLVDKLDCCIYCKSYFKKRFTLIGDYYEKKKRSES
jgi:hypothetical protein